MYAAQMIFCEELEEIIIDDEIDELFSKLEQMEPPASLIEDILTSVAQLPLPQYLSINDGEELDLHALDQIITFPAED